MSQSIDITSANATAILTIEDLYSTGFTLEGFSTDSAVTADDVEFAQTRMGVDGKLAAGYTPNEFAVTITLEANSSSLEKLNEMQSAMQINKKVYICHLQITIPSIGLEYKFSDGVLTSATVMPGLKKILDPTTWSFKFQSKSVSSV